MQEEVITKELQAFNTTDAAIAKLKEDYLCLAVTDMKNQKQIDTVHAARMDVKNRRIAVTKKGKELREDAVKFQKAVIAEEKRIVDLLTPIENHLATEEGKAEAEKARLKAEEEARQAAIIQKRIDRMCAFGCQFNGQAYCLFDMAVPMALLKVCTDEQFEKFAGEIQQRVDAENDRKAQEEAARKAEYERLQKIAAEQKAEADRLEEVARKQAEEAARIKAEQETAERKAQEERDRVVAEQVEREAKIKADQEALEAEKKRIADAEAARAKAIEDEKVHAENEKKRQAELEQARKEAAEKAIRDAAEKAKREAEEKAEAERLAKIKEEKRLARQPDKTKLILLADQVVNAAKFPEMKTEEGETVLDAFRHDLLAAVNNLKSGAEAL